MPGPIGFHSYELQGEAAYLVDGTRRQQGTDVTIASGQVSDIVPNHRHPPGTVVVKRTSTGKYVLADDANGDRNAGASVVSVEVPDSGWASKKLTFEGHFGTIEVTLGATDDSLAEVIAALEGDAAFDAHLLAEDDGGGKLKVTTREVGRAAYLKATSALDGEAAGFGPTGQQANGTDADYRVTLEYAELKDINSVARDYQVPTLLCGHFRESALRHLTAEAKAVLIGRGSLFS